MRSDDDQRATSRHVYQYRPLRAHPFAFAYLVFYGFCLLIWGALTIHRRSGDWNALWGITVVFCGVVILLSIVTSARSAWLEILPTGITLRYMWATLYVPWQELGQVEIIRSLGFWGWEGISVDHPQWRRPWWMPFVRFPFFLPEFIPLWSGGKPWWDRSVGNDLHYYAPWVFYHRTVTVSQPGAHRWGY
jgi:hypothetical protein